MDSFALLAWLSLCALQDAHNKRISNWLTLGGMALASLYLLIAGQTWLGATPGAAISALVLALLFGLPGYALGRFGAADVKLLLFIALASDSQHLLFSLIGAGGGLLLWATLARRVWPKISPARQRLLHAMAPVAANTYPFAPFLLLGLSLALLMPKGS